MTALLKNDTESRLIRAAAELFAKKGYAETSIGDLANVAAVNYRFGDKQTLYREALRYSFQVPNVLRDLASRNRKLEGILTAFEQNQTVAEDATVYARGKEFCEIFRKEMDPLYLLSLLLTGSPEAAEQCFVAGLEDCLRVNAVFREWAHAWSRRAIIKNAIYMFFPAPETASETAGSIPAQADSGSEVSGPLSGVTRLQTFERFVFIMSIFEGYSDQECSTLLNTTRQHVSEARIRALQQLTLAEAEPISPVESERAISIPGRLSRRRHREDCNFWNRLLAGD